MAELVAALPGVGPPTARASRSNSTSPAARSGCSPHLLDRGREQRALLSALRSTPPGPAIPACPPRPAAGKSVGARSILPPRGRSRGVARPQRSRLIIWRCPAGGRFTASEISQQPIEKAMLSSTRHRRFRNDLQIVLAVLAAAPAAAPAHLREGQPRPPVWSTHVFGPPRVNARDPTLCICRRPRRRAQQTRPSRTRSAVYRTMCPEHLGPPDRASAGPHG